MRVAFPAGLVVAAAISLTGTLSCTGAFAETRVALVIGNSAYQRVPRLANPVKDAVAMGEVFKAAGFQVVDLRRDLDANGLRRAIRDFSLVARDADTAVVFFAGHGFELDGSNYLVPTDARLEWDFDVEDEAISLDRVLKMVEQARRLRLVILDACRDNPFLNSMKRSATTRSIGHGLAKVETATPDTLVAFAARAGATAEDGVGEHSPFTRALLKHLAVPGLDVRFAFGRVRDDVWKTTGYRQEPSIYGSLGGDAVSIVPPLPEPPRPVVPDPDELTWDFLKDSIDIAALNRFVDRFPESRLRPKAEARIAALSAASKTRSAPDPAPDEIAWEMVKDSRELGQLRRFVEQFPNSPRRANAERQMAMLTVDKPPEAKPSDQRQVARLLQQELKRVGCDPGAVDGEWGDRSLRALETFNRFAGTKLDTKLASLGALDAVRSRSARVCPLTCGEGMRANGDRCVPIACEGGEAPDGTCRATDEARRPAAPTPSNNEGSRCLVFNGRQICQ